MKAELGVLKAAHTRLETECQTLQEERRRQTEFLMQIQALRKGLEQSEGDEKSRLVFARGISFV